MTSAVTVENYPGFPQGVDGPELVALLRKQAEHFEARFERRLVSRVDFLERPFRIWTEDEEIFKTDTVIIATGASYGWLGLESEQRLRDHGVSACATCDGFFFRGMLPMDAGGTS